MHGSDTNSPALTTPPPGQELAQQKQAALLLSVRETGSIGHGIYAIANNCCNEGHVSLDHIEQIALLARQMCRQLEHLGITLSN